MNNKSIRRARRAGLFGSSILLLVVGLSGCNTIEGAGADIERAGDVIEDTADEAEDALD